MKIDETENGLSWEDIIGYSSCSVFIVEQITSLNTCESNSS
jgi:hypothetical protein